MEQQNAVEASFCLFFFNEWNNSTLSNHHCNVIRCNVLSFVHKKDLFCVFYFRVPLGVSGPIEKNEKRSTNIKTPKKGRTHIIKQTINSFVSLPPVCLSFWNQNESFVWESLGCPWSQGQLCTFYSFVSVHIHLIMPSTTVTKKLLKESFTLHAHWDSLDEDMLGVTGFFDNAILRQVE